MISQNYYKESSKIHGPRKGKLSRKLRACFDGDASVLENCRTYTQSELDTLTKGTAQRGEGIRRFLEDHFSGKKEYFKQRLIPSAALDRIILRNPTIRDVGASLSTQLQFFYGPDVIRDSNGKFRVLEDNIGFVGGFGDLNGHLKARELLSGTGPLANQEDQLYPRMASFYHRQSSLYGNHKILLLSYPRKVAANNEPRRLSSILKTYGIQEITSTKHLKVIDQKLFHQGQRVSFLITNIDVKHIEATKSGDLCEFFLTSVPGFWDAFAKGSFGLSTHPGTECASDKEFYIHVEKMIRFYLKEEPILRNIQALPLSKMADRMKVFKDLDQWVIKSAVGQGGKQVWLGRVLTKRQALQLKKRIDSQPESYVAQKFTELSRLGEHSVDARPLAIISCDGAIVSDLPWGRGACALKGGKVNISSGGLVVISDIFKNEGI